MDKSRAELKAGIVILLAVVILCFMVFVVADISDAWKERVYLIIHFNKVSGIGVGSPVRYAGLEKGKVIDLEHRVIRDPNTKEEQTEVLVLVHIDSDVELRQNDRPQVVELITGTQWIDIASMPGERLEPKKEAKFHGKVLRTYYDLQGLPVTSFADLTQKASSILATVDEMVRGTEGRNLKEIIASLRNTSATLEKISADIRDIVSENKKQINAAVGSVNRTADSIEKLVGRNSEPISEAIADARKMLEENREAIKRVADNLQSITDELKGLVLDNRDNVTEAIEDVKEFAGSLEGIGNRATAVLGEVGEMVAENRADIHQTAVLMRESAAELRLGLEEVRRSPWKLLYKPHEDELALQEAYDSIRAINLAARGVREAADSLEDAKGKRADELRRELAQELRMLEEARARLFDSLVEITGAR